MRRGNAADLARLTEVLREVHDRDGYPLRWPADPRSWLTPAGLVGAWTVSDAAGPVGHVALTDVRGDEPTSATWSAATGTDPGGLVCVSRLFVAPYARGTGAGDALLREVEQVAAHGGRRAVLEVADGDRAALRLYERRGWREVGAVVREWTPTGSTSRLLVAP